MTWAFVLFGSWILGLAIWGLADSVPRADRRKRSTLHWCAGLVVAAALFGMLLFSVLNPDSGDHVQCQDLAPPTCIDP
jgi:hypothetical protein